MNPGLNSLIRLRRMDAIDFRTRHEKMIAQLPLPPETRKIQKDAMKYEINIEFPSKQKEEIDFTRLKKQIKDKVLVLLTKNQVEENQINRSHNHRYRRENREKESAENTEEILTTDKYRKKN